MVGCIDPRKVAMILAGYLDQEEWTKDVHKLNNKLKEAERMMKESAKAEKKAKKKDEEEEAQMGDDTEGQIGLITLRPMLKVSVAGGARVRHRYARHARQGHRVRVRQRHRPDGEAPVQPGAAHRPGLPQGPRAPLNVLVVDYSSIYGTDCPAVDTLLLQEDLGRLLAWEDLQQFLGRLRRDGTAIFYSMRTLRRATLGPGAEEEADKAETEYQRDVEVAMLGFQDKERDEAAEAESLLKLAESKGRSASETGAFAATAVLSFCIPAPANLPAGLAQSHPAEVGARTRSSSPRSVSTSRRTASYWRTLLKKRSDQVQGHRQDRGVGVCPPALS